jgi:hypothetical protein
MEAFAGIDEGWGLLFSGGSSREELRAVYGILAIPRELDHYELSNGMASIP